MDAAIYLLVLIGVMQPADAGFPPGQIFEVVSDQPMTRADCADSLAALPAEMRARASCELAPWARPVRSR